MQCQLKSRNILRDFLFFTQGKLGMTIRVLVNGAQGKMGQLTVNALLNDSRFILAGKAGHADSLKEAISDTHAEVVVDFTHADAVFNNTQTILAAGACPVIGTSGLKEDEVETLKKEAHRLHRGGIIAPNFSLGAVLMMKYAADIASYFPQVEIIEMHHAGKLDSPSGTAIRTAELIAMKRKIDEKPPKNTRETIPGARGATYKEIPIHSIRLQGLMAHQEVLFGGQGETLLIRHDSTDRTCFVPGILLACQKVTSLAALMYGLEHLL